MRDIEVENKIVTLPDRQVILDSDIAEFYGVETKRINEAVRNNPEKFPDGYILQLDNLEFMNLRPKFSTTKKAGWGQHSKTFRIITFLHAISLLSADYFASAVVSLFRGEQI